MKGLVNRNDDSLACRLSFGDSDRACFTIFENGAKDERFACPKFSNQHEELGFASEYVDSAPVRYRIDSVLDYGDYLLFESLDCPALRGAWRLDADPWAR